VRIMLNCKNTQEENPVESASPPVPLSFRRGGEGGEVIGFNPCCLWQN
jgi:hypothetical protein